MIFGLILRYGLNVANNVERKREIVRKIRACAISFGPQLSQPSTKLKFAKINDLRFLYVRPVRLGAASATGVYYSHLSTGG
jgi:hypothetical protein